MKADAINDERLDDVIKQMEVMGQQMQEINSNLMAKIATINQQFETLNDRMGKTEQKIESMENDAYNTTARTYACTCTCTCKSNLFDVYFQ